MKLETFSGSLLDPLQKITEDEAIYALDAGINIRGVEEMNSERNVADFVDIIGTNKKVRCVVIDVRHIMETGLWKTIVVLKRQFPYVP